MTLIGYAYAITPFSMMFEPMFKSYKAAKDWWNLISMSIQILPYVVYSVIFTPPMSQAKTETAHIVSSSLCIFPSFVLQKNLGFLQLTSFMPGDVTWSYVWSWNAGVWFGILMLFVMGSFFWAVVYWMTVRKETHQHGSLSPDVDITNDSDLVEERKRAFHQHDGIHIMDVVKHFPAKASSQILLNRSIKPTKDKLAVKGISIGVAPGELYALLGPNGAGKTTLESCIMQDISTDGGTISLGGRDTVSDVFKDADVGYCPQYDSIFKELRVGDHIKFVAEARGLDTKSNVRHRLHVDTIIRKLGLDSHLLKMAKALSGGYKRKLCLAMALIGHPSILIADEPSTGVDPVSRRSLWTVLKPSDEKRKLIDMPATLLSTHYMEEGDNLATRIGIQIDGQLVTSGSLTRLKEKYCQANFLEATFTQDAPDGADEALFCFLKQQEELEPQMRESLMGRVKIQFPVHSDKSVVQLATLFDLIETNKADLHIEFYNLCSQSLEQIFIDLCKLQEEEKMRAVVDEATS
jgi:ABC-type multidrug transport system ATPase subunit